MASSDAAVKIMRFVGSQRKPLTYCQQPEPESHSGIAASCDLKVTMDTYVQAVSDEKCKAQSKVVEMSVPGIRRRSHKATTHYEKRELNLRIRTI